MEATASARADEESVRIMAVWQSGYEKERKANEATVDITTARDLGDLFVRTSFIKPFV
jgi:hypothetical protein